MEKFVIDPALLQQLSGLKGYTILCDSEGKTLGVYQPVKTQEIHLESPRSMEEIEARRGGTIGKPIEEIFQRLGI